LNAEEGYPLTREPERLDLDYAITVLHPLAVNASP
jgi:hypothetical protein